MGRAGVEPATRGFSVHCSENTSNDTTKTCESDKEQLTLKSTPKTQKLAEIDTQNLTDDLLEIVMAWPDLPEHIKEAIKALIQPYKAEKK